MSDLVNYMTRERIYPFDKPERIKTITSCEHGVCVTYHHRYEWDFYPTRHHRVQYLKGITTHYYRVGRRWKKLTYHSNNTLMYALANIGVAYSPDSIDSPMEFLAASEMLGKTVFDLVMFSREYDLEPGESYDRLRQSGLPDYEALADRYRKLKAFL